MVAAFCMHRFPHSSQWIWFIPHCNYYKRRAQTWRYQLFYPVMFLCHFILLPVKVEEEDEEGPVEENEEDEEEEENLEKALSVERFGDIISDSASTSGDRMGRHYTEKDFECKQNYCVNNMPTIWNSHILSYFEYLPYFLDFIANYCTGNVSFLHFPDGLPWHFVQTFMVPIGWIPVKYPVNLLHGLSWHFLQWLTVPEGCILNIFIVSRG